MFKRKKQKNIALLAFAAAFIIWGINTVYIKIAVTEIPPNFYYLIRFAIPALILIPFILRGYKKPNPYQWFVLIIASIIGFVVPNILLAEGLRRTSAIDTSLIFLLGPVLMFAFSIEFLKEKFNAKILLGLVVSLAGAALVVVGPSLYNIKTNGDLYGNILILLSAITATAGIVIIKPILKKLPALQITTIRFALATLFTVPLVYLEHPNISAINWTPEVNFALFYGVVFGSLVAYVLYHFGLSKISGEESSTLQYLDPLAGVLAALFILGEQITPIVIVGGALTVVGVYLSEAKSKHKLRHLHAHR